MLSITEKYEKFLLTDELKEQFSKLSVNKNPFNKAVPEIVIEIIQQNNGVIENISEEKDYAKLVRTSEGDRAIR